jgi:hypothetical protein
VVTIVDEAGGILEQRATAASDARGFVVEVLNRWRPRLGSVCVDSIGVGFHLSTHLRDGGFRVRAVNVAVTAHDTGRFANLKAEAFWTLRELFRAGGISGLSADCASELSAIRYGLDSKARIVIGSKDELKKQLGRSPDLAESLMLASSGRISAEAVRKFIRQAQKWLVARQCVEVGTVAVGSNALLKLWRGDFRAI